MMPLPEFLRLMEEFEQAVVKKTEADMSGQPAAVRRMALAEYKRTERALRLQIHNIY